MPRPSQKFSGGAQLPFTILAGMLVGLVVGCAQSTATSEAEPELAPQSDSTAWSATSSPEIQKRRHESIATILQGRTSGVLVSTNDRGELVVRIRGADSFYGSNQPLYVIDDVPMQAGPGGALAGINPYEIESIRVLKGPPETTLYGVRGANGVILIKTRRPGKP